MQQLYAFLRAVLTDKYIMEALYPHYARVQVFREACARSNLSHTPVQPEAWVKMDKGTINFSNGASSKTCHREDQNPSQYACGDEEEDARAARATAVADEYEQLVADLSRRWPRALREDSRTGRQQHAAWDDDEDFDDVIEFLDDYETNDNIVVDARSIARLRAYNYYIDARLPRVQSSVVPHSRSLSFSTR